MEFFISWPVLLNFCKNHLFFCQKETQLNKKVEKFNCMNIFYKSYRTEISHPFPSVISSDHSFKWHFFKHFPIYRMSRRTWGERSTCKVQNDSLSNINFSFWCVNMHIEGEWKENMAVFQKSLTTSYQSPPPLICFNRQRHDYGIFFLWENRMKPMPKKAGHFNTSLYFTSSFSYFALFNKFDRL